MRVPVPVVLYNIPKYMHFALPPALVAELAPHENVIGIKDSSGNPSLFASYLQSQSDSFAVLTGNAPMFHHALEAGRARRDSRRRAVRRRRSSLDVYDSFLQAETTPRRRRRSRELTPLGAKIVGELGVAGVKAAMDRRWT